MQSELFSIQSEQGVLEVFHPFFKRRRGGEQLREFCFFLNFIYLFTYIQNARVVICLFQLSSSVQK